MNDRASLTRVCAGVTTCVILSVIGIDRAESQGQDASCGRQRDLALVNGELTKADETVSRHDAIYLYSSVEQGWFTKEDELLGGIDVGRFADIAALSADVFDPEVVSDEDIRQMTSVLTIVGGEIVHDAGVLVTP